MKYMAIANDLKELNLKLDHLRQRVDVVERAMIGQKNPLDELFDLVNRNVGNGGISAESCGAFYSLMLQAGVKSDVVLKHAKLVSNTMPQKVREEVFERIAGRNLSTYR